MTNHKNPDALAAFDKLVEMAEKAGFCQPEFFLVRVPYARSILEAALIPKTSGIQYNISGKDNYDAGPNDWKTVEQLIEIAKAKPSGGEYNRRECFADSNDGLMAFIHYGELLNAGVDQGLDRTNSNGEIEGSSPSPRSTTPSPDYVMVPREPTGYMLLQGSYQFNETKIDIGTSVLSDKVYKAMLDAAPEREGS